MNYYQLETKEQDSDFINGKVIFCEAAVTEREFNLHPIKEGDALVIRLSNGAKYLGKILQFDYTLKNGMISGELKIKRVVRGA